MQQNSIYDKSLKESFSKYNLTPRQLIRCTLGSVLRFFIFRRPGNVRGCFTNTVITNTQYGTLEYEISGLQGFTKLHDWFKSYGNVKCRIVNGCILPSGSFCYQWGYAVYCTTNILSAFYNSKIILEKFLLKQTIILQ